MLELPFTSGKKYIAGHFNCKSCIHKTIIFIEENYSLMNFMDVKKICDICKKQKEIVTDGDLILRYDYPEADNAPWQLQGAGVMDEDRICEDCYKLDTLNDWKKLIVNCTKCDGIMYAI